MKDKTETLRAEIEIADGYVVSMEVDSVTTIERHPYGDTYAEEVIKDLDWDNAKAFVNGEEVAWLEDFLIEKLEEKLK